MRVTSTIAPPDGSAPPSETTTDPDNWRGLGLHAVVTDRDGNVLTALAVEAVEDGNKDPINDVDDSLPARRGCSAAPG
jgi:hypothetical protein